ncbi:MAG TPA: helix-turn-helix transcriptional regulator [Firmicutes bacterium]|nr:helix-turn-helix transcriptional regulator [Bacillota bacterium]
MLTNLRVLRVRSGLKASELARRLGLAETMLIRIELAQAYVPPKWRRPLAEALGVEPEAIMDPATGWPKLAA